MNAPNQSWEESDQYLPPPPAKVPRHLHLWIALGLCVLVLLGFGLQALWSSQGTKSVTAGSNEAHSADQELAQEPPVARLHDLINHQKESVATPIKPSHHSAEENSVSRLQKLEEDKQRALVASSRMLAINRGPVLAQPPLAPAVPSLPVATSNLSNLLPGGVSTIPAGLSTKARTVLAENRGEAEAAPVRLRNLTPLTPSNPASQRLVFEGTLIPAVLLTQITSDLPGMITAQVTEDVYDSLHGSFLAIPKGSRLIGEYASHVITGQERITASFHRLILPKGQSFSLEAMQAADSVGQSGMQDEVDSRFWKRLGGQFMTAGLARILTPSSGGITILGGSGNTLGLDAAGQILVDTTRTGFQGNASLGPVIVIKKGYPFVILVNQDMDFATVMP